jgi:ABC-type nitrate/sulfonate/bicarbonate transport system permease component
MSPAPAGARPGQARRWRVSRARLLNAVSLLTLLAAWYAVTRAELIHPFLLSSPREVLEEAWDLTRTGVIFRFAGVSLLRVLQGFLIGAGLAVPLGMLIGRIRTLHDLFDPILELARPVPALALIPLAIAWFGIGELSKVFLIAYAAFFPVLINVITGFHSVDPVHVRAARSLRASELQIFRDVVLMSAFPHIVAGLRIGMGMAFLVLVAAELIASNAGLGYLIQEARLNFHTPRIFVGIIAIGLLGYVLSKTLLELERRVVPWKSL